MGGAASKSPPVSPQSPKSTSQFITPKHEVVNTTPKSKDLFKQVSTEVASIEKSKSQSKINLHNELQKSASKSKFLDNVKARKEIEQQKKEEQNRRERSASQAKIEAENLKKRSRESSVSSTASSIKKPINEFDDKPKKLDDIFGKLVDARATPAPSEPAVTAVYVDPNFDPGQKDIKGMSESVKLKKSSKKPIKEETYFLTQPNCLQTSKRAKL